MINSDSFKLGSMTLMAEIPNINYTNGNACFIATDVIVSTDLDFF